MDDKCQRAQSNFIDGYTPIRRSIKFWGSDNKYYEEWEALNYRPKDKEAKLIFELRDCLTIYAADSGFSSRETKYYFTFMKNTYTLIDHA